MSTSHSSALNFDVLFDVAQYTLFSPVFVGGLGLFLYGQVRTTEVFEVKAIFAYWFACALAWFLCSSSRIWENKSWRYGLSGIIGTHRIDWSDEIVLVTGGTSGVGKAMVDILDVKKVTVVCLSNVLPSVAEKKEYNDVHFYECDVSKNQQVQAAAKRIREEVGIPTVVINNAGVVSGRSILDLSEDEIQRTFDVNTVAHFWMIKAFLPDMLKRGRGHIVSISSLLSQISVANLSDYCASKAALIGLHESLRAELRVNHPSNAIRTTLVFPSHIRTPLFSNLKPFSPVNAFLFPMLEPYQVAKAIVDQVEREESAVICLPKLVNFAWVARGAPSWLIDAVKWFSQADVAMSDFHKTQ